MDNEDILLERSTHGDVQILRFLVPSITDTVAVLLIEDEFQRVIRRGADQAPKVVIDMSAIRFLPTTVLAKMVSFYKNLKEIDGHLALCGLNEAIKEAFKITGFSKLFKISPDL